MNDLKRFFRREHAVAQPFSTVLKRAAIKPLTIMAPFVIIAGLLTVLVQIGAIQQSMTFAPHHEGSGHDISIDIPKESTPEALVKHRADCWVGGEQPKAQLPGAAVVRFTKTDKVVYTTKHSLVDAAFSEALLSAGFAGKQSKLIDVVALCK